jgi:hypothetical protein
MYPQKAPYLLPQDPPDTKTVVTLLGKPVFCCCRAYLTERRRSITKRNRKRNVSQHVSGVKQGAGLLLTHREFLPDVTRHRHEPRADLTVIRAFIADLLPCLILEGSFLRR